MSACTETLFAVHKTLLTTPRVKGYMREFEDAYHVAIVYTLSESLPAIGAIVNTSRPDREVRDPLDVKVVEIIQRALVRGERARSAMRVNLVIGELLPPESYPALVTNPICPRRRSAARRSRTMSTDATVAR